MTSRSRAVLRLLPAATVFAYAVHAAPAPVAGATSALEGRGAPEAQVGIEGLWLAPPTPGVVSDTFGRAVADLGDGRAERALPVFTAASRDPIVGGYGLLYLGRAQLALDRFDQAATTARQLINRPAEGYLHEAALLLAADAAEQAGKWSEAVVAVQALVDLKPPSLALAYLRLGRAAMRTGDVALARRSFNTVHYQYPLSAEADDAAVELGRLPASSAPAAEVYKLDLNRAQQLYGGKKFADARKAFEAVRLRSTGDDRSLIDLRLAECDYSLQKYPVARDALRAYIEKGTSRTSEAEYFYLSTLRALKREDDYVASVQQYVARYPGLPLAETALNELATYYILANDDARAAAVFEDLFARFPAGVYGDRAVWKAGWWAYKNGDYPKTVRLFEAGIAAFRRSDYRPTWLYWSARAHEQLGHREAALASYRQAVSDYRNSYYGRLAAGESARVLTGGRPASGITLAAAARPPALMIAAGTPPPNARLVQGLLVAGLYDDAILELRRYAAVAGVSPLIDATIAYALNRKGELRPAITAMRRAYPQFMADGGEALPTSILRVIFPIEHWDLIRKYSAAHKLDPYLMTALIAQESTFQADARSVANAWGLMQIVPATGRRYARPLGVRPFTTGKLTDPETNIRIGMAYFADLVDQFGDVADALAAYNAGESRVSRWRAERPGVRRDEFIDDIPFPETQNYVKRVIGTAENYRDLYGPTTAALTALRP